MIGNIGPGRSPGASEWRLLRGRKAFAATAGNGATGTVAFADTTGQIELSAIYAYTSEALVSVSNTGTLSLGTVGDDGIFSAPTTANGTNFALGKWWNGSAGATSDVSENLILPEALALAPIATSSNILGAVATNNISDGQLDFFFWWRPLSSNGNLVLATGMTAI